MDHLAAWGPTLVSAIVMVFTAGMLVSKQNAHDTRITDLEGDSKSYGIAIAKLEAWRDGYNAALFRHQDHQQSAEQQPTR